MDQGLWKLLYGTLCARMIPPKTSKDDTSMNLADLVKSVNRMLRIEAVWGRDRPVPIRSREFVPETLDADNINSFNWTLVPGGRWLMQLLHHADLFVWDLDAESIEASFWQAINGSEPKGCILHTDFDFERAPEMVRFMVGETQSVN